MLDDLSDDAANKLMAGLNYDLADTDKTLPAEYLAACRRWYDALTHSQRIIAAAARGISPSDKLVTKAARAAFDRGDDAGALKAAAALPPAPVCPLI